MLAFINHFILNTVDFLNKFIANCEAKFIEFDTKLQKVESSLLIVEAKVRIIAFKSISIPLTIHVLIIIQLASMPDANESPTTSQSKPDDSIAVTTSNESTEQPNIEKSADESRTEAAPTNIESKDETDGTETIVKGIKITEDVRYRKYFKMLQMGVPAAAVKMKMQIEGFDGTMLE